MTRVPPTLEERAKAAGARYDVEFTRHALERCWERRIDPFDAARAARNPSRTGPSELGPKHCRCELRLARGRRVYVAICAADDPRLILLETAGWRERHQEGL